MVRIIIVAPPVYLAVVRLIVIGTGFGFEVRTGFGTVGTGFKKFFYIVYPIFFR